MTKRVGFYKEKLESSPEIAAKYPSMRDSFADRPIENKTQIIEFILNGGELDITSGAITKDVFTGEPTGILSGIRTDGRYSWGMDLAYYVDRYNLQLPEEFTKHALNA